VWRRRLIHPTYRFLNLFPMVRWDMLADGVGKTVSINSADLRGGRGQEIFSFS